MNKEDGIREILRRSEWMYSMDITREVGCTQGRVSQVIRKIREIEGAAVIERPVGQRVMFRQLFGDEEANWRADRKGAQDKRLRRQAMQRVKSRLTELRDAVDSSSSWSTVSLRRKTIRADDARQRRPASRSEIRNDHSVTSISIVPYRSQRDRRPTPPTAGFAAVAHATPDG